MAFLNRAKYSLDLLRKLETRRWDSKFKDPLWAFITNLSGAIATETTSKGRKFLTLVKTM